MLFKNYHVQKQASTVHRNRSHSKLALSNVDFVMESSTSHPGFGNGSEKIEALASRLRLYKAPTPSTPFQNDEDEKMAEAVVSAVPEMFRAKRAAVLICLFEDDAGVLRVFLTKRSSTLRTHSGEVSLPGGKAEEGDNNDKDTATREAHEEIGLDPSLVNVVTVLEPFLSKHLLRVIPVIGILEDKKTFAPEPDADEVEAVFDAPLEMFLKDENRRSEEREWQGNKFLIHFCDYKTENKRFVIWGLTAGILIRAASIVYQRLPEFLEQKPGFRDPSLSTRNQ